MAGPLVVALGALALAVAAAVAPAVPQRSTFSWPPARMPDQRPVRSWFAPLMLNERSAESIRVRTPCRPGAVLPGAGRNAVLFETARDVQGEGGLAVEALHDPSRLLVRIGRTTLARFEIPPTGACALAVRIDGKHWAVRLLPHGQRASGALPSRVRVNGLISQIDLRASPRLEVVVAPTPQDTRASEAQIVMRLLALCMLVTSLVLALRQSGARIGVPRLLGEPVLPDALVGATLFLWWIVGPVYPDDGWVAARQTNALRSGGFSNYYDHHAVDLPFGAWLEWLQHLVVAHTNALILQRVPTIVCLVLLWLVCRGTLAAIVGRPPRRGDAAWWSSAAVFAAGSAAYGVTLRPEPVNALLAAGVLFSMVRFALRPSLPPLAAAGLLAGLAVTEHPEGVVALAPLLLGVPAILRQVRARSAIRPGGVLVVFVAAVAWTLLLAFLDSDLEHRLAQSRSMRDIGHNWGVSGEWARYVFLMGYGSSPLRREFAGVCVLLAIAVLSRRGRRWRPGERAASASVGLGLVLLAFVPSKWIWHFGVLVGFGAVAAGAEASRLRAGESSRSQSSWDRAVMSVVGLLLVTGIALVVGKGLSDIEAWGPLDLRSVSWSSIPFRPLGVLSIGLAAVAITAAAAMQGFRGSTFAPRVAWRTAAWSPPVVLVLLLMLTTSAFVADSVATATSTPARQNVESLLGRSTCGVADDVTIPEVRSMTPALRVDRRRVLATARRSWSFAGVSVLAAGRVPRASAWYRLPTGGRGVGFYLREPHARGPLALTWGKIDRGRVVAVGSGGVNLAALNRRRSDPAGWTFVAESSFTAAPDHADAFRFRFPAAAPSRAGIRITAPVVYTRLLLRRRIERPSTVTLVSPYFLELAPCARMPVIAWGAAQAPSLIVDWNYPPAATDPTDDASGPFGAVRDLFDVRRLPLLEKDPPRYLRVYEVAVDRRDALVAATRSSA